MLTPLPPSLSACGVGGNRRTQRKPTTYGKTLTDSFHMSPKRSQKRKALGLTTAPPKPHTYTYLLKNVELMH
jgi:hypothetical protein